MKEKLSEPRILGGRKGILETQRTSHRESQLIWSDF